MESDEWALINTKLNEYPESLLAEAFWHLDNAGAILISFKAIDPRPARASSPTTDSPIFTLVPVPWGHKVVLQRYVSPSSYLNGQGPLTKSICSSVSGNGQYFSEDGVEHTLYQESTLVLNTLNALFLDGIG